jgi:adenine phosphoribosyltransferase
MTLEQIKTFIRDIPDFPEPGVVFKDITPLLGNVCAFERTVDLLAERIAAHAPATIIAIESRGFIFGAALAVKLHLPLKLVRKPGKLPYRTAGVSYDLEYGSDRVEIHEDAIAAGERCAVVDDLIATGGTTAATADLVELQKGRVACCAFVIELGFLHGRDRLGARPVESLIRY